MTANAGAGGERREAGGVLAGVLVLDLGTTPAARFLGRLFADCGARVVALPHGTGSDEDWWLSLSKELLPSAHDFPELRALLGVANIVIDDFEAGRRGHAFFDTLDEINAAAVHVTLSPFGLDGPYAAFHADPNLAEALSGMTWERGGDRARPPLPLQSNLLAHAVATNAFAPAMVALSVARTSGRGQRVDVSAIEALVTMNEALAAMYPWNGASPTRLWDAYNYLPGILRCKDGWARAQIATADHWDLLEQVLMAGEGVDLPFRTQQERILGADALRDALAPWFAQQGARDVFLRGQELRMHVAWCPPIGQLATEDHFRQRGTFATLEGRTIPVGPVGDAPDVVVPPAPPKPCAPALPATAAPAAAAPPPAAPFDAAAPLSWLKVVDLTHFWAGPMVTRILADYGADVLHFESFTRPDGMRMVLQADNLAHDRPWERGWAAFVNRSKRSIALDPSRPEGRELLLEFVAEADLIIENFTPRVMRNWGLSYERLREANPRIVFASLSGFGAEGPWSNFVALGSALEALAGHCGLALYPGDDRPNVVDSTLSDPVSGFWAAGLVLAAIERARVTGTGARIDFSELDACISLIGDEYARPGLRQPPVALRYLPLPAAGQDQWVVVDTETVTLERVQAAGLTVVPGEAAVDALARSVSGLEKRAAMLRFQEAGIAIAAVLDAREVFYDPQLRARRFFVPMEHPVFASYPLSAPCGRLSRTPGAIRTRAPLLGEHTEEVLREHGCDAARIARLEEAGVIATHPQPAVTSEPVRLESWVETGAMSKPEPGARARLVADLRREAAR